MTLSKTQTFTAAQMGEISAVIKRIRRKAEIMRMDQKQSGSTRYHDSNEILTLLDMLDLKLGVNQ
jgi:hypothetical protein